MMKDSGKLLQTVHTGMVNAGLDVNAIYARIGFDSRKLSEQELRTPNELQAAFWQAVESVPAIPTSACTCARTCRCTAARSSTTCS